MFDAFKFVRDYRIDHATTGNKHCRPGWVQVHCPFCTGERDYHLGYSLKGDFWTCWRCKGKSTVKVVRALVKCSWAEAFKIVEKYSGGSPRRRRPEREKKNPVKVDVRKSCVLPPGTRDMNERHKQYLIKRRLDPDRLESVYHLKGTGPVGPYNFRIIIPIEYRGRVVSYQGRDITGKSEIPYKACAMAKEVIHHKHILYGLDLTRNETCCIVEGVVDGWRLGPGAIGTFGTGYTQEQATLLYKRYKRLFLLFDPEPAAQKTAKQLADYLCGMKREVIIVNLEKGEGEDPGDMKQDDANALMRDMGLKGWNE